MLNPIYLRVAVNMATDVYLAGFCKGHNNYKETKEIHDFAS